MKWVLGFITFGVTLLGILLIERMFQKQNIRDFEEERSLFNSLLATIWQQVRVDEMEQILAVLRQMVALQEKLPSWYDCGNRLVFHNQVVDVLQSWVKQTILCVDLGMVCCVQAWPETFRALQLLAEHGVNVDSIDAAKIYDDGRLSTLSSFALHVTLSLAADQIPTDRRLVLEAEARAIMELLASAPDLSTKISAGEAENYHLVQTWATGAFLPDPAA